MAYRGPREPRGVDRLVTLASLVAAGVWALAVGGGCGRVGFQDRVETYGGGGLLTDGAAPIEASSRDGVADDSSAAPDVMRSDTGLDDATGTDSGTGDADEGSVDAARCSLTGPATVDYCATIPFLPDSPVIDGLPECGITLREMVPVAWTGGATPPDATAEYAVAWRPDGIYFFVHVRDASLVPAEPAQFSWQGDEVELYVDSDGRYSAPPAYDNPGTRQFTISAPPDAQSSVARAQVWFPGEVGTTDWASTAFRAYGRPDGYDVEAFVTGPDLGLPSQALVGGGQVGVDLSIGVSYPADRGPDAGGGGNRLGQYFLRVADADAGGGIPPFDPRAFCVPSLAPP